MNVTAGDLFRHRRETAEP